MDIAQSKFYKKWSLQRENKWKFLLLHGSLSWMLFGVIFIVNHRIFWGETLGLGKMAYIIFTSAVVGLLFPGYYRFKQNEKRFAGLQQEENSLTEEIRSLSRDKVLIYENLTLTCPDDQNLVVRNNLFWLEEDQPTTNQCIECMQELQNEVRKLQVNNEFSVLITNRKIKLELCNNQKIILYTKEIDS